MRTRPIQNSTVRATRPFYQKERASVQKPQEQDEFIPTRAKEPHVLQPESGRSYRVNKENSRAITLSFDKRAVAFFQNSDVQIDLEQAALLTSDGTVSYTHLTLPTIYSV